MGSKCPSHERNKLFRFEIKATLKLQASVTNETAYYL